VAKYNSFLTKIGFYEFIPACDLGVEMVVFMAYFLYIIFESGFRGY
jgi:hypothetical protein